MAVTFNGPELRIEISSVGNYDAGVDLYSDWKEWTKTSDNAKYPPAFDTTSGDPIPGGTLDAAYFLRNDLGWRIVVPAATGEIDIVGNLYPRDETLPSFIRPAGDVLLVRQIVSAMAIAVETGVSGLTPTEAAALASIDANVDVAVSTRGTDSDTADAVWSKTLP
jgi:hypothetical protein